MQNRLSTNRHITPGTPITYTNHCPAAVPSAHSPCAPRPPVRWLLASTPRRCASLYLERRVPLNHRHHRQVETARPGARARRATTAPTPPHPPSSCAKVTRSRLAVCKNEKNEDSEKAEFRHLPPGHFVRAFFDHPAGGNPYATLYDTITESLSLCTVVY
jgi:hypothetical protein